jgi:hypothetical protein
MLEEVKTSKSNTWRLNTHQKPKNLHYRKLKANTKRVFFEKLYDRNTNQVSCVVCVCVLIC